jgi:signal transduction histidine kinase
VVALGAKETDEAYSPQEVTALSALTKTASVAAENVVMFEALQNRVRELDQERAFSAALARDLSEAQEKERSRLSDHLHDSVLQDLGIALRLLAGLRDQLQQALGALEDSELAIQGLDASVLRADVADGGETTIANITNPQVEIRKLLRECQGILGSLLGETHAGCSCPEPGEGRASTPVKRPLSTGEQGLVEGVLSLVRSSNQRLREICTNLHPAYLDAPLVKTLSRSVERLDQVSPGVKIEMKVRGREPADLGNHVKYLCKKITEQAVHNALEHATPTSVRVELVFPEPGAADRSLALCITDDGRGFEVRTPHYWRMTRHHGLASMYETATLIGGSLDIESALGRGTRVNLQMPPDAVGSSPDSSHAAAGAPVLRPVSRGTAPSDAL